MPIPSTRQALFMSFLSEMLGPASFVVLSDWEGTLFHECLIFKNLEKKIRNLEEIKTPLFHKDILNLKKIML